MRVSIFKKVSAVKPNVVFSPTQIMSNPDESNSIKTYAKFSAFAAQMGITIFLGAYLGKYLDQCYPADKKWFTMLFTILSVSLSLYILLRQINKHNEKMDKK